MYFLLRNWDEVDQPVVLQVHLLALFDDNSDVGFLAFFRKVSHSSQHFKDN